MRAAVWVISLCASVIVLLQSSVLGSGYLGASHSIKEGIAVGVLLALIYAIGAVFVMGMPLVSMIVFTFGALLALSPAAHAVKDLQVWGILGFVLAVLSLLGHREKVKRNRVATRAGL